MTARADVLAKIRAAVSAGAGSGAPVVVPRDYAVAGAHAAGAVELVELMTDRLVDYRATVHRCAPADVAATVRFALGDATSVVVPVGLPSQMTSSCVDLMIRVDGDPTLSAIELDGISAVLTAARVGCAVTGTIVLDGSADQGRRVISLIPDRHVIVLHADQIVQTWPETVRLLEPTRPLTMISGPSATSDIELSRVEGVHGPRDLHVVIVS